MYDKIFFDKKYLRFCFISVITRMQAYLYKKMFLLLLMHKMLFEPCYVMLDNKEVLHKVVEFILVHLHAVIKGWIQNS